MLPLGELGHFMPLLQISWLPWRECEVGSVKAERKKLEANSTEIKGRKHLLADLVSERKSNFKLCWQRQKGQRFKMGELISLKKQCSLLCLQDLREETIFKGRKLKAEKYWCGSSTMKSQMKYFNGTNEDGLTGRCEQFSSWIGAFSPQEVWK